MQYTCVQSEEEMSAKFQNLALVMALGVLSCLLFLLAIRHIVLGSRIQVAEWDMQIVTVNDYSVELDINKKGYESWLKNIFKKEGRDFSKNISPGLSLKRYLIHKIEKQLTKELEAYNEQKIAESISQNGVKTSILKRDTTIRTSTESIKIADLTFCRDNASMIVLLKKRGSAIAEQDFDKVRAIE